MSPITTTITMPMTTIPRKSVNMVAELALWIPDTTERQEDYSTVAKAATTTAVTVGHKGPCSTENSYSTEERSRPISTVQDRSQDSDGFSR